MRSVTAVILAAGMGTRMRSHTVKVLHSLGGRPMILHVIDAVKKAGVDRVIVVVGHQADRVQETVGDAAEFVEQREQLGTAHAVRQAEGALQGSEGLVLVTYGDTPLYRPETYRRLFEAHGKSQSEATVLSAVVDEPAGYGRVVRDEAGAFQSIIEQRDIESAEIEKINEINTGTYCFDVTSLLYALKRVRNDNQQGEYYLPDTFQVLIERGSGVSIQRLDDASEALGINDRVQLAEAERVIRGRVLRELMEAGVTIVDPESTVVHSTVRIGRDSVVHPFTLLEGHTQIGESCEIGPHARIRDSKIGNGVVVDGARVEKSDVGDGAAIGPFTHVRPGSKVGPHERVAPQQTGRD